MSFKVNTYEKSRAAFDRALKVIPSGIYGHQARPRLLYPQ